MRRLPVVFRSDCRRVIRASSIRATRPESGASWSESAASAADKLTDCWKGCFASSARHANIATVFDENYRTAMLMAGILDDLSHNRRQLIGSYFTAEYSIESAALFNPSIVPHYSQHKLADGAVRFIMKSSRRRAKGTCRRSYSARA